MTLEGLTPAAPAGAEGVAPTGTEPAAAEDPTVKLIEDYRKRQAGAEKARQEAERQRDEALRELEAARSSKPAPKPAEGSQDFEARMAELEAKYQKQAEERIAKVTGDALTARFPTARAKFPEITDPVKLAELEVLYTEQELPTPVGNNQQRQAAPKNIESMSSKELQAYMKTLDPSVMGLSPQN